MHNVVSLSGGKDSTAMLLMMLERGETITDIVFFDGGWEFPQMHEHLVKLEDFIGRKITRLSPRLPIGTITDKSPFEWMLTEYPVKKRGTETVRFKGRGWPHPSRRWCTGRKQEALKAHMLALSYQQGVSLPLYNCIGFGADEEERVSGITKKSSIYIVSRYPLIEWGITEAHALAYCKDRGFTWGGLYNHFSRVSCFCCPLQRKKDLKTLYTHYPDLWRKMLAMDSCIKKGSGGHSFKDSLLVHLDRRFLLEALRPTLFDIKPPLVAAAL